MPKHHNAPNTAMGGDAIRSTFYLEPELLQALRIKAATAHRSMSEIVNDAIRAALREDEEDLAAFAERAGETAVSYETIRAKLEADGRL